MILLTGFGAGMTFTSCYIIVGEYFDKNKGKAMGLSTMGCGLGTLFFGPLISYISNSYGYFGTILILGGLQFNIAVGGMLYRPVQQYKKTSNETITLRSSSRSEEVGSAHPTSPQNIKKTTKFYSGLCSEGSLLRNWTFLLFCILMAGMQICIQAFLLFMPAYSLELGATQTQASLLVSFYGGGDVIGRIVFGVLFDVTKLRPYRVYIYCAMSVVYGVVTMAVGLTSNYIVCAVLTTLSGMMQAGCHGQRATVVGDIVSKSQLAKGVGFLMFSQGLGSITGAPFAGRSRPSPPFFFINAYYGGSVD